MTFPARRIARNDVIVLGQNKTKAVGDTEFHVRPKKLMELPRGPLIVRYVEEKATLFLSKHVNNTRSSPEVR